MQTVVVASADHDTSGEFVNDHYLAVGGNYVVGIAAHGTVSLDSLVDMVEQGKVLGIHEVDDAKRLLRLLHARFGKCSGACLFVYDVVAVEKVVIRLIVYLDYGYGLQGLCEAVCELIELGGFLALTGYDKRGTRFVYEYRVYLIDDSEGVLALYLVLLVHYHVVTQVIEAEFVVRAVGYIGIIGYTLFSLIHILENAADSEP